jgi:ubiquinone/menaquinone biosynthesis C-methylase UbiE
MQKDFNQKPITTLKSTNRDIVCFKTAFEAENIDHSVVKSFGEEWKKFHDFDDAEINRLGNMYFDIITEKMVNKNMYGLDIGCGTGRFTKFLLDKIGFMEAIDPSDAIFTADQLIGKKENVRLSKASTDNIPFDDETFDFAMSIGVLHHIPDTQKAMNDCVKKVKVGGYFYTYLYYDLENKGFIFKLLLSVVTFIRQIVSSLPNKLKKIVCDLIAVFVYMPVILLGRLFKIIGLNQIGDKLPLNIYHNQTFFVIRNDALDRFGTSLEQRFSKAQITEMMTNAGLTDIIIAETLPYWHAVGKKK